MPQVSTTTAKQMIASRSSVNPWGQDPQKVTEHAELIAALNTEARENWDNEAWHRQVAQDIANTLDYGFTFDNLFSTYFNVETVGEFDRIRLRERRGLKVFYTSRGGYIEESQIRTEEWELPRDTMGFHVSEHIDKLRANFAVAIQDMVSLGEARLDAEVNRRIFTLMQQAIPTGSDEYVASTGLAKAEVDAAVREVRDAIKPNGMGPVPVTIAGRASMIDKISEFAGYASEAQEEIRLRGRLGTYKGANLVEISNYTDEDGDSYIPANELWVFGGNVGKFALFGGLQVKTWDENTVDYRHYRARKDVGGLIHHAEQARRVVDSSVTP